MGIESLAEGDFNGIPTKTSDSMGFHRIFLQHVFEIPWACNILFTGYVTRILEMSGFGPLVYHRFPSILGKSPLFRHNDTPIQHEGW